MSNHSPINTFADVERYFSGVELQCLICGRWYEHLGRHLSRHEITAPEYRQQFNLPANRGLVGTRLREHLQTEMTQRIASGIVSTDHMLVPGWGGKAGARYVPTYNRARSSERMLARQMVGTRAYVENHPRSSWTAEQFRAAALRHYGRTWQTAAAAKLGVHRQTMRYWMQQGRIPLYAQQHFDALPEPATAARMGATHRWTAAEVCLVGTDTDEAIAERIGRSIDAVKNKRLTMHSHRVNRQRRHNEIQDGVGLELDS